MASKEEVGERRQTGTQSQHTPNGQSLSAVARTEVTILHPTPALLDTLFSCWGGNILLYILSDFRTINQ